MSTTPSCRAMELNYVQKKCKLTANNPLWKLLNMDIEGFPGSVVLCKGLSSIMEKRETDNSVKCHTEPILEPSNPRKLTVQSPPIKRPCITLFRRVRLGLHEPIHIKAEDKIISGDSGSYQISNKSEICILQNKEVGEGDLTSLEKIELINATETSNIVEFRSLAEIKSGDSGSTLMPFSKAETCAVQLTDAVEVEYKTLTEYKEVDASQTKIVLEDSESNKRHYSERMRKFYGSMHVLMPQPLPSLVDLMNENKRAKRRL